MNEPQVWTLIGVFAASMLGTVALLMRQNDRMIDGFRREMSAQFSAMDAKFDARFSSIDARFDAIDTRFGAMDTRFGAIERKLEDLDKEVANLATRIWGSR